MTEILPNWQKAQDVSDVVRIFVCEDYDEEKDADVKYLDIEVDTTDFEYEDFEYFDKAMSELKHIQSDSILPIEYIVYEDEDENEYGRETYFIRCLLPETQTVRHYFATNENAFEEEYKSTIKDLIEIYEIVTHKKIPVCLSVDDISLCLFKNEMSPYLKLCVSPFAFIQGLLNKIVEDKSELFSPFAHVFEFFDSHIKNFNANKKQFNEIVIQLNKNKSIKDQLRFHNYIKSCQEDQEINKFNIKNVEVEKIMGAGCFGGVILVKDKRTNKKYAIKQSAFENIASLQREAFVMNALNGYPNIVEFKGFCKDKINLIASVDAGKYQKQVEEISDNDNKEFGYLEMEFCPYGDLQDYIRNNYSNPNDFVPFDDLCVLVGQVIASILYLHQKRFVHRDLKAANILIKQLQPFIWLKLCDFGFARANNAVMTTSVGTPLTADPNLLNGKGYTDRAELYSMGCIIYFIIYKRYPHSGCKSIDELAEKVLEEGAIKYFLPNDDKRYEPFIDLMKMLLDVSDRKVSKDHASKKRSEKEKYWNQCITHPCTQFCLQKTTEAFTKHVSSSSFKK